MYRPYGFNSFLNQVVTLPPLVSDLFSEDLCPTHAGFMSSVVDETEPHEHAGCASCRGVPWWTLLALSRCPTKCF